MKCDIAVIKGDGIGPEITDAAIFCLNETAKRFGHTFSYAEFSAGGAAYDMYGEPLRGADLIEIKRRDALLLGAIGGVKWDGLPAHLRPEQALFALRSGLGLFANLRPVFLYDSMADICPLKNDVTRGGVDMLIVRELTGGIYFGERGRTGGGLNAYDTEVYTQAEIRRIAKRAFESALLRRGRVTSVDKANVLESSRLWRETVAGEVKNYPGIVLNHMYVDNAAMQLIRDPSQFDVILTSNMFGDILSDEAGVLAGSIGLLPSASMGEGNFGLYEPIHGSAPDIAGHDIANPIGAILSAVMMLKHTFGLHDEARAAENAVIAVLERGYATADICRGQKTKIGTAEMGRLICENISGKNMA